MKNKSRKYNILYIIYVVVHIVINISMIISTVCIKIADNDSELKKYNTSENMRNIQIVTIVLMIMYFIITGIYNMHTNNERGNDNEFKD